MAHKKLYDIFKAGSKTYFYSSLFFPSKIREDVFVLYSFVRRADDFVDSVPQRRGDFIEFKKKYERALGGENTGDIVVDSFVSLVERKNFDPCWVSSFLKSMEADLSWKGNKSMREVEGYIYGSAEVVGLMMAAIIGLPNVSYPYARLLGKSMQYINFIRDIAEDLRLGRSYFPAEDFESFGLVGLDLESTSQIPESFKGFVRRQLSYYDEWQREAEKWFEYIPKKYLIPIKTASELYKWTANQIRRDPFIVYRRKVKPSIPRIISNIGYNALPL
ncbi:MAG: phytoene/squalene synthase family protein [Candidatus Altiarchaeota archaeon]|nr:phytoene/squalene synthase family protein [Candidatus Altiarchaeota archaeon]